MSGVFYVYIWFKLGNIWLYKRLKLFGTNIERLVRLHVKVKDVYYAKSF